MRPAAAGTSVCIEESPGPHCVMPPRKKGAKVNTATGRGHGRSRGAAAHEASKEPAPIVEDAPAPSEPEAESTAPALLPRWT